MSWRVTNLILLTTVLVLMVLPLALRSNAEFGGADERAEAAIGEIAPHYRPWTSAPWEPPSGEVETLLFSLQTALGAGVLGYYFGYQKGRGR